MVMLPMPVVTRFSLILKGHVRRPAVGWPARRRPSHNLSPNRPTATEMPVLCLTQIARQF
jgi:hypothetical protein